ncbi:MAG: hypothetical protein WBK28_02735 [Minisyncoccia bacterium]
MEPLQPIPPVSPVPEMPTAAPKPRSSVGVVIGLIVIVVVIVLGAYYFLNERVEEEVLQNTALEELSEQGASTDPASIETDLAAENPDEFDAELDAALYELDGAFEGQ